MIAKRQFGLINYPFPKAAQGKTFFDKSPGYARLARSFQHLVEEPGLATLCADAGLGKTARRSRSLPRDSTVLGTINYNSISSNEELVGHGVPPIGHHTVDSFLRCNTAREVEL